MRWSGQELAADEALPGLKLGNLVRSVTTPEFAGIRFHEVVAKSALNHVPGDSAMPFNWTINPYRGCSHACTFCLGAETLVLMADGTQKPLWDVRVGDRVYGTAIRGRYRRYVITTVLAHWQTRKPAHLVTLADGTRLTASGEHRFLTDRGWKHVTGSGSGAATRPHLTTNNSLVGFGSTGLDEIDRAPLHSAHYRRGYLSGMIRGDGHLAELISWRCEEPLAWHRGFLAGIFDAEGSHSRGILRISNGDEEILDQIRDSMDELGITHTTDGPNAIGVGHSCHRGPAGS